jgi:hypothetical protein
MQLGTQKWSEVKEDEWMEEARKAAEELSPKVDEMLSGRSNVEILHWVVSKEAAFTLLLYDAGRPLSLMDILREGLRRDVLPKEWNVLSCLAALQKRGWLSVQGREYCLNPKARRTIEEIAGEGDWWKRQSVLDEWMIHNPAKPLTRD